MRRADQNRADAGAVGCLLAQQTQRGENAAGDVGRRRRLYGSLDASVRHQDGIRVGAADVDAHALHDANADRKSMS